MRISKIEQVNRESVLMTFFADNPTATIRQANEALKAQTGRAMDARKVANIRRKMTEHNETIQTLVEVLKDEIAATPAVILDPADVLPKE